LQAVKIWAQLFHHKIWLGMLFVTKISSLNLTTDRATALKKQRSLKLQKSKAMSNTISVCSCKRIMLAIAQKDTNFLSGVA
jgi:hypothetical protein